MYKSWQKTGEIVSFHINTSNYNTLTLTSKKITNRVGVALRTWGLFRPRAYKVDCTIRLLQFEITRFTEFFFRKKENKIDAVRNLYCWRLILNRQCLVIYSRCFTPLFGAARNKTSLLIGMYVRSFFETNKYQNRQCSVISSRKTIWFPSYIFLFFHMRSSRQI